jgi:membrane-bound metal-dependent hydrolase YbcI (DUF457 family)
MVSWYFAEAARLESARDRRIVAWAGFAPDLDVLAYIGALAYYRLDKDLAFENVWQVVHHRYTHNLGFVLVTGIVAYLLAGPRRAAVAGYAMLACAIHNFLDIVAGGPTWPVYPLWPLSPLPWSASWSWTIGDWPNLVVLFACLGGALAYARHVGRSPLECFGERADAWLVRTVRGGGATGGGRTRWLIWAAVLLAVIAVLAPLM